MSSFKLEHKGPQHEANHRLPDRGQAAAYVHDMATSLRRLALQHEMKTLGLLLEMVAQEAAGEAQR